MSTTRESEAALGATGLVPITAAAKRLGRTPWTLKRWYREGLLPVVTIAGLWYVPESFLLLVLSSPQPKKAGVLEELAAQWFEAHSAPAAEVGA